MTEPEQLEAILALIEPVASAFEAAGHELYLVGGVVRDLLLGEPNKDIDLTTSARPEETRRLVSPLASALWTQGERFGTIGAEVGGRPLEITTYRAESYDADSRKPVVSFGDDLDVDLSRRDFTINAMAIDATDGVLVDPYGGESDLDNRLLRTPLDPAISFTDDPLRMLRAARFIPRFELSVDAGLSDAVVELGHRLSIVSAERIHDEFERLLAVERPHLGMYFLVATRLMAEVAPQLDRERWAQAAAVASTDASPLVRRAAFCATIGGRPDDGEPSAGEAWLRARKYSTADRVLTSRVAEASIDAARADAELGDPWLRRIAQSLGADTIDTVLSTASVLGASSDTIDAARRRSDVLASTEDLDDFSPPIDGQAVIELLGIEPGPLVGEAMGVLLEHRLEHGPSDVATATELVERWFAART